MDVVVAVMILMVVGDGEMENKRVVKVMALAVEVEKKQEVM